MPDTNSFNTLQEIGVVKILAGVAGSVISLRFVQGKWYEKVLMIIGGAILAILAASPVAAYVGMSSSEGLVGFLIGLFGMAVASKVYEIIQSVDTKQTSQAFFDWLLRRPPTPPKD